MVQVKTPYRFFSPKPFHHFAPTKNAPSRQPSRHRCPAKNGPKIRLSAPRLGPSAPTPPYRKGAAPFPRICAGSISRPLFGASSKSGWAAL